MRVVCLFLFVWICGVLTALTAEDSVMGRGVGLPDMAALATNRNFFGNWEGTITLVDTNRNLVVLQNGARAMAVRMDLKTPLPQPGERVSIEGHVSPYFAAFPDYPDQPSGKAVQSTFEGPSNWADHYLTRMRGFLHPPATGLYTFWIASDDDSELRLSPDQDPAKAGKIAFVSGWTSPRQWDRYPTQKSEPILLKAGETYYIEAMHEETIGDDCLAVSWQGPGLSQSVIEGRYLSPWPDTVSGKTNGILREYWTNFFTGSLSVLAPGRYETPRIKLSEPRIKVLGQGIPPKACRISVGQPWADEHNFQWVEVEGAVNFVADRHHGTLALELADGDATMEVRVLGWGINSPVRLENTRLRVQGVCESVSNARGERIAGIIWVPDLREISLLGFSDEDWPDTKPVQIFDLTPSNPNMAWGRKVLVRGTVVRQEPKAGQLLIRGDDSFHGYISADGTNWSGIGTPIPVAMSNSVYTGLAVSSQANDLLAEATFDQVKGLSGASQGLDIGNPVQKGSSSHEDSIFTVRGSGRDIWYNRDQFHFLGEPRQGECEIVARVKVVQSARPLGKAGVMIRESLDAGSPCVALLMDSKIGLALQCRQAQGEISRTVDTVGRQAPQWLRLVRHQNVLRVRTRENVDLRPGQVVNVMGALTWENGAPVLTEAYCRPIPESSSAVRPLNPAEGPQDVQIRRLLSETEDTLRYANDRFRIRGVVTFSDRVFNKNHLFIQDESAGTAIRFPRALLASPPRVGQFVEVVGGLAFVKDMPPFSLGKIIVLGRGKMPQPMPFPNRAQAGKADGQWTEAEGIVRSTRADGTMLIMEKEGLLPAWIGRTSANVLSRYVNALVRVRGVFSLQATNGPMLLVPSQDFVEAKELPPEDPFIIPAFPINRLSSLGTSPQRLHRLKVTGVVTYRRERLLFLQDDSGGAKVWTMAPAAVNPGDQVEVVGFPESDGESGTLFEALVRKTGSGQTPKPAGLAQDEITEGKFGASLVQLEAVVLNQRTRGENQILELQAGQRVFQATLATNLGHLASLPAGSRVRLIGVNQVQFVNRANLAAGSKDQPLAATLEVLLRTPADVILLQRPPWWNWKHTVGVIGLFVVVLVMAMVWIRTLRRRVEERTRELQHTMAKLQKETRTSATLAERDRLAGEIHDSLEQGLSAIMMQLDAAAKLVQDPEGILRYLGLARNMAEFSRAEVQHAVWDLQSPMLEDAGLGMALTRIANEISAGNSPRATVEIVGSIRSLPSAVEHHLLRIGQEAVTNAVKHAQPRSIQVTLDYSGQNVRLSVRDDGLGFVPERVLTGGSGHFGLQGLRTRARKINAELTISSEPGKGTVIEVAVPLNGSPPEPS